MKMDIMKLNILMKEKYPIENKINIFYLLIVI